MSKSVMASIQPYYVFLIIAKYMGWDIPQDKKVEVRKGFPKDKCWNKKVNIYCSKSKKSFNRIPKEYQPLMRPFLGKVIGEFIVKGMLIPFNSLKSLANQSCLTEEELFAYSKGNKLYGWRIADLKIYDKPTELSEFRNLQGQTIKRPFQSWGYVEELEVHNAE